MKRINYLDGWRGFAVLFVLVGHFVSIKALNFGVLGVELFFVLSGRLMAEILFVDRVEVPEFFRRRVSRVWPATVAYVLTALIVLGGSIIAMNHPITVMDAVRAVTFTLNYKLVSGQNVAALNHIWSLCVEEHTYLFLAAVAILCRRTRFRPPAICVTVAALCILNGLWQTIAFDLAYNQIYWRTDVRAASILLSVAIWLRYRDRDWPAFAPVLFIVLGTLMNLPLMPDYVKHSVGTAFFAFALTAMRSAPAWSLKILENPLITRIGIWSFSIYLWQQPFSVAVHDHGPAVVVLLLLGAFACALASFYCVEQPARRFLNSRWNAKKEPTSLSVPAASPIVQP